MTVHAVPLVGRSSHAVDEARVSRRARTVALICAAGLFSVLAVTPAVSAARVASLAAGPSYYGGPTARPTDSVIALDRRPVGNAAMVVHGTRTLPGPDDALAQTGPATVVPSAGALRAARMYLRRRRGVAAFAVVDSRGRTRGVAAHARFVSASVVKAMLLVAQLRAARGRSLTAPERALLGPMIRTSSNRAATRVFRSVGGSGLRRLARAVGMRRFSVGPTWPSAKITASDQARLFFRLDRLLPMRHSEYGRELLSTVVASQSWGIPTAARPRWRVYFKGGWRRTGRGRLVHQVARLEDGERTVVIAILTDGAPSHRYGTRTVYEAARLLLSGEPAPPAPG